jgi:uncharacterized protein YgbK (DUF1537 family)
MIGVIADDLTGAAELAGIGHRYGLRSDVIVRGGWNSDAELICVDTDSRSVSANEAARRAASAARKLRKAGARWIYKKVDSVLRGNVFAEVSAVQQALAFRSALLAPANPGFGRVIKNGQYFVNGKRINETDFARDPQYPRTSANVHELLGMAETQAVTVCGLTKAIPTAGIILAEVSSSADVQEWASRLDRDMLPAGGAEFFAALLAKILRREKNGASRRRGKAADAKNFASQRELFICGSSSDYTERFVREARRNGTPVFSIVQPDSNDSYSKRFVDTLVQQTIIEFRRHLRVVIAIGRPLLDGPNIARELTKRLVKTAVAVIVQAKPEHLYAEGGATAAELVRQLKWKRMRVVIELAPGVITLLSPERKFPTLTIKPGSYSGWPKLR